eukprot:SAG31_NODE_14127_length_826_cov_0.737276_2_plen_94_part_00
MAALKAELERNGATKVSASQSKSLQENDVSESAAAVEEVVEQTAVELLRKLFDSIDSDHNGYLSRQEFDAALGETVITKSGKVKPSSRAKQLR